MAESSTQRTVARALLSVSDKAGIVELGQGLHAAGVEILSTGGTAKLLAEADVPVTEVGDHTGFPEIMAGRVKTLHPTVHGGILGRRGIDADVMEEHGIAPIDLVVVNLYPFAETVAKPGCSLEDAIENIDIGGPAMVRAAAKNHADVLIVTDPEDYVGVLQALSDGGTTLEQRFALAAKAYAHTADYDGMIANYLSSRLESEKVQVFPAVLSQQYYKVEDLRYGENPHQQAAFYRDPRTTGANVANAKQLQGKALSYNNIADTDAALSCVKQFDQPACVIVKHANPCGVAEAESIDAAYEGAYRTDPTSAFGGIIAFNRPLDAALAKKIIERQFVEVIIAPSVDADALEITASKANVRVLECGEWTAQTPTWRTSCVEGGLLVQDDDQKVVTLDELKVVTERSPSDEELADLLFAWRVAKFVKSNAIVYAREACTVGVGAGQMSRVYSARIAGIKAADEGIEVPGAVMASDAFFPFRDGIDAAAEAGIKAVVQPGGSMRDDEVIAAANEHGIAMVFTGIHPVRSNEVAGVTARVAD